MNTVLASSSVVALVVYTGIDSRASMNSSHPRTKVGLVDLEINNLSKALAFVTIVMSLTMVALDGMRPLWYVYAIRFLILFSSIIPISLRVNLDMGKAFYSYCIMNDDKIPATIVRTSTIPEELGRIDYLLTDKTGTLTKNEMEMKKVHMGTLAYGTEGMSEIRDHVLAVIAEFASDHNTFGFARKRGIANRVFDIVLGLSLCHNVIYCKLGDSND